MIEDSIDELLDRVGRLESALVDLHLLERVPRWEHGPYIIQPLLPDRPPMRTPRHPAKEND